MANTPAVNLLLVSNCLLRLERGFSGSLQPLVSFGRASSGHRLIGGAAIVDFIACLSLPFRSNGVLTRSGFFALTTNRSLSSPLFGCGQAGLGYFDSLGDQQCGKKTCQQAG